MNSSITNPTTCSPTRRTRIASAGSTTGRLVAGLAAAVLVTSACAGDDDGAGIVVETSVPATSDNPATAPTTSAPAAATESPPTDATTTPPAEPTTSPPIAPAESPLTEPTAPATTAPRELTTEQAGARALEEAPPGSTLDDEVYAETVDGQPAWEIEVEHPDGSDWDYYIHRITGELLEADPEG